MLNGEEGKREGMARAERAADPHWKQCMLECGRQIAETKPYFYVDDIVYLCRQLHPNAATHDKRAIGPLMRQMAYLGWCEKTHDHVESTQAQCHQRPMRVWRSLIYQGPSWRGRLPRRPSAPDPRFIAAVPVPKPNFGNRLKLTLEQV